MFKKVNLQNGAPVLMETAREVHSVCIGIWVKVGSRNEHPVKNGISHFLEHMFFKGTEDRTAHDIAMEIDSLGGELNAFTTSEYTVYYVKVLNEYIEQSLRLLTDILLHSTFPVEDLEKEKNIVYEEIKMVEDNPADYVHDIFNRHIWGDTGLGQSVLGRVESIGAFKRDDLMGHIKNFYGCDNIVVACSGNFDESHLLDRLGRTIGTIGASGIRKNDSCPEFSGGLNVITKDLSESHICIGVKGLPYRSEQRYTMHLLNTVFGSGISSRLFQNIREKRGLAYSIYSYHVAYADTGLWSVYAGTDKRHVSEVVSITINEMNDLYRSITDDELQRAKAQLKGNLILALESTSNKMTNIAKQEIYYGKYFTPEEIIEMVEAVTLEDVRELSRTLLKDNSFALTVYGPVKEKDLKDACTLLQ